MQLKANVLAKISNDVNRETVDLVVQSYLKPHLNKAGPGSFQEYYFFTLRNEQDFLESKAFFRKFKSQYSLQGIDNDFLDKLESKKTAILADLHKNKLADLYFNNFANAEIKHGENKIVKDLGSFFAKLVHTFKPNDYCALDNPIKNYFGLKKESFFVSFILISSAYKLWAASNDIILYEIRQGFKKIDASHVVPHDKITDLKLLDLIYWSIANNN